MVDAMDVWRTVRAELIERGIKCPVAETLATKTAAMWKDARAKGLDTIAKRLTMPEYFDTLAAAVKNNSN